MPTTATPPTIGQTMKRRRFETDKTQEELGFLCGVSRQTIMSIERGETQPGFELAHKIAKHLEFSLDDVVPNHRHAKH